MASHIFNNRGICGLVDWLGFSKGSSNPNRWLMQTHWLVAPTRLAINLWLSFCSVDWLGFSKGGSNPNRWLMQTHWLAAPTWLAITSWLSFWTVMETIMNNVWANWKRVSSINSSIWQYIHVINWKIPSYKRSSTINHSKNCGLWPHPGKITSSTRGYMHNIIIHICGSSFANEIWL